MGILIKGMEMPEGRGEYELLLRIDLNGTATVEGSYLRFEGEPFEAVPVQPHGRLIDADALIKPRNQHIDVHSDEWYVEVRTIEDAPTIIEEER